MKSIVTVAFALWLTVAYAGVHAMDDQEFRQAAEEGKIGVPEMLRRLREAAPHLAEPSAPDAFDFEGVFVVAAKRAQGAELDELAKVLRAVPADWFGFDQCFSAYATARIRERVAQLVQDPVHLDWRRSPREIPKELADAPASFRDAWRLYRTVMGPYRALVDPPEKAKVLPKNEHSLEFDLLRVVGEPEPDAWKHLVTQVWGSWCGTGSESLYHPRNRALLLSFLADRKWQEATGAVLAQVPTPDNNGHEFDSIAVDLLTALRIDWEQVMFGSLLQESRRNLATGKPIVSGDFDEYDAWHLLAARGSAHAVLQCVDLIRRDRLDPWDAGQFLLVALGPWPARPGGLELASPIRSDRTVALPPEIRRECISVFAEYLAAKKSPADLMSAMRTVPPEAVRDLRTPLDALLRHHVHPVAAEALRLLTQAGLATGREQIVPATPPLRFRFVLNGKPLIGERVSVWAKAIPKRDQKKHPEVYDLSPGGDFTTDENGAIVCSLEKCLEPTRIGAVEFHMGPQLNMAVFGDGLFGDGMAAGLLPDQPNTPDGEWVGSKKETVCDMAVVG